MSNKRHWVGMNGSSGCLPDSCNSYPTKRDAAEGVAATFPEVRGVKTALLRDGFYAFGAPDRAGADYASIEPCNCATPDCHNDC